MIFETLLIGILVAVLYVEIMDIYPGGIIVPAYFALHLDSPLRIVATLLIAALTLLTYKMLSHSFILYGKRRFALLILLGVVWAQLWALIFPVLFVSSLELKAIGWIIPALLANNLEKQKVIPTLASLFTVSIVTYFLVRLLGWIIY
ncbi:poly-gamma-glutamate biosynthesis protein PgsC [Acidobacteriota bacterium]